MTEIVSSAMNAVTWLEAHEGLSGWAQFAGAMLALVVTYLTAFIPIWNRKRQLRKAAARLLSHGYEVLESYHRTTPNFLPVSLSLRGGVMVVSGVIDEISRFPVYELEDQGSRSLARHLVAVNTSLLHIRLVFESMAATIEGREATVEERDMIMEALNQQLELVRKMLAGEELKRPVWPGAET
jgi:hypothetical protein